jgi:hypothetical protein
LAQKRYNLLFTNGLNRVRLRELDERFAELLQAEEEFPAQLPDMKDLYTDFYNEMTELTKNIVCVSCGCIDRHLGKFTSVSVDDASLHLLQVDRSLVPFDFKSGITTLDESHIMIDPMASSTRHLSTSVALAKKVSKPKCYRLSRLQITDGLAQSRLSSRI